MLEQALQKPAKSPSTWQLTTRGAPSGASDLYLIAELYFDNAAAREAALVSNEGKAAEADLPKFADGIVSVYFGIGREP